MQMETHKKKPYMKAVIFGLISIASYIILFRNVGVVMDSFTRGGIYAALPVGSVFYFSFLHGAFASNVIELMGLQAKKKR